MGTLWGGRFQKEADRRVREFQDSLSFDFRLWPYDIKGSQAHAQMLVKIGVLAPDEGEAIIKGLAKIYAEFAAGKVQPEGEEDIHSLVEALLVRWVGEVGKKLHTGRSRNDQIATDLRLYLRDEISAVRQLLKELRRALVDVAAEHVETLMPGFTHLQPAQPVTFAHHLLAYYEMFTRDDARLVDCYRRTNVLPLGAGALAGTTFPLDRAYVAELLGFEAVAANSMDAVSDRDFVVEFCAAAALTMVHLSRLAEEIVLWSTPQFGFVELDDAFATGSSMMPQKKNPDVAELCRGKTGRVVGNLTGMLLLLKGLPLTYNKDLQEDKPLLFDTVDTLKACLTVFGPLLRTMKVNRERLAAAARAGFIAATDLAEYLVRKGLPFRDAHAVVGRVVLYCLERGKTFEELTLEEYRQFATVVDADVFAAIGLEASLKARRVPGGPAPDLTRERIETLKNLLR
ncbi:argininosuccinate lyase [Thermodesulfitimonas autotrophica]|uniref:argininosuccinate lyase n=1 Tax=Thermodesulfitimonas autotrophica TaxID=1894989 RepID=UPI002FE184A6